MTHNIFLYYIDQSVLCSISSKAAWAQASWRCHTHLWTEDSGPAWWALYLWVSSTHTAFIYLWVQRNSQLRLYLYSVQKYKWTIKLSKNMKLSRFSFKYFLVITYSCKSSQQSYLLILIRLKQRLTIKQSKVPLWLQPSGVCL